MNLRNRAAAVATAVVAIAVAVRLADILLRPVLPALLVIGGLLLLIRFMLRR